MRRSPVALVPAAVGLLLAACVGDRDTTAPKSASNAASFTQAAPPVTCDFTAMKQDASHFFSASNDAVFGMISNMKTTRQSSGAAAATPMGFNIFAEISKARLTSRQTLSPASAFDAAEIAGGQLVADVALCTNLGTIDATTAATALRSGVFEVRGSAVDPTGPALAKPEVFPRWGVEPTPTPTRPPTATPWPIIAGTPRYLIYGVPGAAASTLGGEPLAVDGFVGFDVSSFPATLPKTGLLVGICVKTTDADGNAVNRLIHTGDIVSEAAPSFCGAPIASLSTSAWFASVANRVTSVFAPALLHAQDGDTRDYLSFTGGGPSSWSPMAWGKIKGASVGLSFTTQPKNGFDNAPLATFVVHSATPNHPLAGTSVTITVFSNNGVPAGAFVSGDFTVAANANGDATFTNVTVNKAGGYTLTATATYGGVPTGSAISAKFNIKNR